MKGFGYHEGDRSEFLALFAFSTIAYCSPVPRQYDHFGVDFFAHLARWEEEHKSLVATGRAICGQVKSDTKPILLEGKEQLACLYDPSVAFFYVVINKNEHSMQIYSMADRLHAHWSGWTGRLWVVPSEAPPDPKPTKAVDGDHYLCLGKPIYSKPLDVLENKESKKQERRLLFSLIEKWAWWEQIHLAFKEIRLPLYTKIATYVTNEVPDVDHEKLSHLFYSRPDYLEPLCRGMRLHIQILRDTITDIQQSQANTDVPDFDAWAENVVGSINAFLEASELPPPAE